MRFGEAAKERNEPILNAVSPRHRSGSTDGVIVSMTARQIMGANDLRRAEHGRFDNYLQRYRAAGSGLHRGDGGPGAGHSDWCGRVQRSAC